MFNIISEIGINYDGNFDLINEMIRQSKMGGADYAKIQLYTSKLIWGDDSRKKNELNFEQVKKIKELCEILDIQFLTTVNDLEKLEWCEKLDQKVYKVSSYILKNDKNFVQEVINTGKLVYVPLGMWDSKNMPFNEKNVRYMYCVSNYPTYWDQLTNFPNKFDGKPFYGFSDHSYGISACLLAISRGAQIIEKHFTLNKASSGARDHIGSMNLDELKILSTYGRELHMLKQTINDG